jgi:hypothetical protein
LSLDGGAPSEVGLPHGLPGHAEYVSDRRPRNSRRSEVRDVSLDLLLNLSAGLHQLVQVSQALATTGGGGCLLCRL